MSRQRKPVQTDEFLILF